MTRIARNRGITLIELLVALVIVGILGAVALPAYFSQARKSYRAEVKAILMENAQFMERYYTTNRTYAGASPLTTVSPKASTGAGVKYNISWSVAPTASAYTIQAVPANSQASDSCGTLTMSNTGAQTAGASNCW